tara:strand:- start:95 stop:370 length:276 start_codon:yes stop_codon:yes gene_type:complete
MKTEVLTRYAISQEKRLYSTFRTLRKDLEELEEERRMLKLSKSDLSANLIFTHYSDDIHEPIVFKYKDYIKYHENMSTYHLNAYRRRYEDK